MPYYIAFDNSHKERAKLDENYTELRDFLNENDFICYNFLEIPITQESIKPYDILVIACPDFSKLSHIEIMEIVNWVKEDGGGLLLLSHAGGDKGRSSNLSELSEQFGIIFENDQVLDEKNNIGIENMPIIDSNNFIPPHPITNGISSLCYRAGCSLTIIGNAISIVSSNDTSEPFSCPLICTAEPENGRVCAIGSYEMFRDQTGGGFQYKEHEKLALNVFNWLISDYRLELTKQGTEHTLPISTKPAQAFQEGVVTSDKSPDFKAMEILEPIEFSTKAELIETLNSYLNQINMIKNNLIRLLEVVSESSEELFSEQDIEQIKTKSKMPTNPDFIYEPYDEDEEGGGLKDIFPVGPKKLTALPPKPQGLGKKEGETDDEGFIRPVPTPPAKIKEVPEASEKVKTKIKSEKDAKLDKNNLKAELDGLENKMSSVLNLITFIDKKHDKGKLDDKSYKKQTEKLQKDLENTKKRIKEIKEQLD
ncbi:MAG: hypothetical protein EU539_04995 [Promethearchaeota archaeon]|nr:MAG: hypothetical protein EU539_04995 [Candidatus Lokiarchaeota archaeon]